jgi:FkbM family methyltransferase
LLGSDKIKEKVLEALSVRRVIERGWLTALLSLYVAKRREAKVRLKHIGDVTLQRKDFGALARLTYNVTKCWPEFLENLTRIAGSLLSQGLLSPHEVIPWLESVLPLTYLCNKLQSQGRKVTLSVSPKRISLEIDDTYIAFNPLCITKILGDTFVREDYGVPEALSGLRGRDVIDVGANIGDTALYFVLNGARKVIAVEPLPNVARCAEENVRLSGAADKVKVINAALSDEPVSVPCDYDLLSSRYFSTLSSSGPCKVPGVTLGDLLNMVDDPYLLKMDCEGCEAQVILGPERERLRAFKHIIFEAHPCTTGVSNEKLLVSLKELGFECRLHKMLDPKCNLVIYYCRGTSNQTSPS